MGLGPHGVRAPWGKGPMGLGPLGFRAPWGKGPMELRPHGVRAPCHMGRGSLEMLGLCKNASGRGIGLLIGKQLLVLCEHSHK